MSTVYISLKLSVTLSMSKCSVLLVTTQRDDNMRRHEDCISSRSQSLPPVVVGPESLAAPLPRALTRPIGAGLFASSGVRSCGANRSPCVSWRHLYHHVEHSAAEWSERSR